MAFGIDLDDGLDHGVHEIAVMRDHQDGAGVVQQVALEPEQGDEIEVVGRLVEHQQIRLHDEELGEVGAHHPAAGIFAGGFREVLLLEAETGEDLLRLRLQLVAVERGELILRFAELRGGKVAGFLAFADGAEQADHFRGDADGDLEDGLVGWFAGFLREVAGDRVFVAVDGAFVGLVLIENHAEKGRFPGAVRADQGDAFAPVDRHFRLTEKRAATEGLGQFLDREHGEGVIRDGREIKDKEREW